MDGNFTFGSLLPFALAPCTTVAAASVSELGDNLRQAVTFLEQETSQDFLILQLEAKLCLAFSSQGLSSFSTVEPEVSLPWH